MAKLSQLGLQTCVAAWRYWKRKEFADWVDRHFAFVPGLMDRAFIAGAEWERRRVLDILERAGGCEGIIEEVRGGG